MDSVERARLKQLANDSVIATFGYDNTESRLALALESAVEEFEFIATGCDHCKFCDVHGEVEDDEISIDANEIIRIHGELKKSLQAFKDLHHKFDDADEVTDIPDLVNELASQIEELESGIDELEAEVAP